jgi:acetyltransferase
MVVIGVSLKRINLGKIIVMNNAAIMFNGKLYGVGREEGEVSGVKIYDCIAKLPEVPEVAIIITPAKTVPDLLKQCGEKKIMHVVIESGGFSEYSHGNRNLEKEVKDIAKQYGIRIIGPNCIGTVCIEQRLMMPFALFKGKPLPPGPISIISQSGGVGDYYMKIAIENHVFFNKFAAIGNKLDVDEVDCLDYMLNDEKTKSIFMYLEGFSRGREFFDIAIKSDKPIVMQKSNRSPMSAKIAQSHTAALSAADDVVGSALHQAAVIRVKDESELILAAKCLVMPIMKGDRVAVLSRSGGHAIITVDACHKYGFNLIEFPASYLEKIKTLYDTNVIAHQNPLDLGEIFDYTIFIKILEETLKLDNVDGVIFNHLYQATYEAEMSRKFLDGVNELVKKYDKPVAVTLIAEAEEILDIQMNHPYPTFITPLQATTALWGSHYYYLRRKARDSRGEPKAYPLDHKLIDAVKQKCFAEKRAPLTNEALEICGAAGISHLPFAVIKSENDIDGLSIKYPVALKLLSKDASHKTDVGGVRLGVLSPEDIKNAVGDMREALSAHSPKTSINGFLVQEMSAKGEEFFVGANRDPVFGPVVVAGFGGIFIEVLKDRAIRLAPVTETEVRDMLEQLKTYPILTGVRGRTALDIDALVDLICRVSWLIYKRDDIMEFDLNPVIVKPKGQGISIVDSRVFFK